MGGLGDCWGFDDGLIVPNGKLIFCWAWVKLDWVTYDWLSFIDWELERPEPALSCLCMDRMGIDGLLLISWPSRLLNFTKFLVLWALLGWYIIMGWLAYLAGISLSFFSFVRARELAGAGIIIVLFWMLNGCIDFCFFWQDWYYFNFENINFIYNIKQHDYAIYCASK